MYPLPDVAPGEWIRPLLSGWATVTSIAPAGYPDYVRVFHPTGNPACGNSGWSHVASVTGAVMHPTAQWWRLIDSADAINPSSELWSGGQPMTGLLDEDLAADVLATLRGFTDTADDCFFAIWEGTSWYDDHDIERVVDDGDDRARLIRTLARGPRLEHPMGRNYVLVSGSCDEFAAVQDAVSNINLMWPADHAWCMATEIDYDSTIVGCSTAAADALLAADGVEAMRVGPTDRLDSEADEVNSVVGSFTGPDRSSWWRRYRGGST